jgi:ADP-ribose pyrophosphatase
MKVVFDTPWFEVQARESQTHGQPHYVVVPPDYVSVIPMTEKGEVILVEQFRPATGGMTLEFPSGHVDPGETPEQSARKELVEETGFEADQWQYLGVLNPDTGRLGNRIWYYLASNVKPSSTQVEEGIRVVTMPLPELLEKIRKGEFTHALHCAALMLASVKGLIPTNI